LVALIQGNSQIEKEDLKKEEPPDSSEIGKSTYLNSPEEKLLVDNSNVIEIKDDFMKSESF